MKARARDEADDPGSSGLVSLCLLVVLLAVAALAWIHGLEPARQRRDERFAFRDRLERSIAEQEHTAETLTVLRTCLESDLQTVERELRDLGYGREGEEIWMLVSADEASRSR